MSALTTSTRHARPDEHESGVFSTCPECGAHMEPMTDGWSTDMYCAACDARWRFTMGWVSRVRVPPTSE